MGTRNRERRRVKVRQRSTAQKARRTERRRAGFDPDGHLATPFVGMPVAEVAGMLLAEAVQAVCRRDEDAVRIYVDALAERPGDDQWCVEVDRVALASALAQVGLAWRRGWQPADLHRWLLRTLGAVPARMLLELIAAQLRPYRPETLDPRWLAQLAGLGATVRCGRDDELLTLWVRRHGLSRRDVLEALARLCHELRCAPEIGCLGPLPGQARAAGPARTGGNSDGNPGDHAGDHAGYSRVLDRVRALLAKAEATEFAEEAEALTAKAQQLMARHSIDEALLGVEQSGGPEPQGIRIGIDNPYEAAKSLLLQQVAAANRSRAVWSKSLGFTTVVGFPADLEAVELLYTSLLVRATTALVGAGPRRDAYGRSRTRAFRQSFLTSYAIRIGERLRTASADVRQEAAAQDGRLLPVLAAREDRVRAKMAQLFPAATASEVRISDREGWASGRAAADLATLHARQAVGPR